VDPNRKDDGTGDFGAVLTVARDSDGNHFVLDLFHGKPNSIELVAVMREHVVKWRPLSVFFEALCGQKLLMPWIKRDMMDSGVAYPIQESKRPFGIGKPIRIRALAGVIETGKLWVPHSKVFTPLLKEIEHYTGANKTPKDDCLDCLADIYSDGFDASRGSGKRGGKVTAPWQTPLLDDMISHQMGGRPKVTCSERLSLWR